MAIVRPLAARICLLAGTPAAISLNPFPLAAALATTPMTDAGAQELARKALALTDPAQRREALDQLRAHRFKSSLVPEREFVLYTTGILEDRLGESAKAALTFRKLERTWPKSSYLSEAQITLAMAALERRRLPEAESRLKRALQSEIPVEAKRRAQELLLWTLVEQGRGSEGQPILKTLFPRAGDEKPTERGLVAMVEVLCLAREREQAESASKDLHELYPGSPLMPRADLALARLLGAEGNTKASADLLARIVTEKPGTPEADEARLALASLLSEGKLKPREIEAYPTVQKLLEDLKPSDRKDDTQRRKLLIQLRVSMNEARWKEAVDLATQLRRQEPSPEQGALATQLRAEALRAWVQQSLDAKATGPLLPYLDREGIASMSPQQRVILSSRLAQGGLGGAVQALIALAPAPEREALRRAALEALPRGTQPEDTLALLPAKGERPGDALRRAQALIGLHRWAEARPALGRATPGEERIAALLSYLRRPAPQGEGPGARLQEAASWLAQARERGLVREPLAILVADLRARSGDWRGALALYPPEAAPENRGWVALMRATCQSRLGQKEAAKATLRAAVDVPGFQMERRTLAKQLGL